MKYAAQGKWNVRITNDTGKVLILSYYGYKTKREAESQAEIARRIPGYDVEVVKERSGLPGRWM